MQNRFVAKLEGLVPLSADDRAALVAACANAKDLPADTTIALAGTKPHDVHVILEGWGARYQMLEDGSRQITAFLVPGDLCDQHVTILGTMDHSICTITEAKVAYLSNGELEEIAKARPEVARALWWSTLVDEAVLREWIVSIGRRNSRAALSHLLCELHARLWNVGLVGDHHCTLPITQEELADALGLTPVTVNRALKELREEGLVTLRLRVLTIPDVPKLRAVAGFNGVYLHHRSNGETAQLKAS